MDVGDLLAAGGVWEHLSSVSSPPYEWRCYLPYSEISPLCSVTRRLESYLTHWKRPTISKPASPTNAAAGSVGCVEKPGLQRATGESSLDSDGDGAGEQVCCICWKLLPEFRKGQFFARMAPLTLSRWALKCTLVLFNPTCCNFICKYPSQSY